MKIKTLLLKLNSIYLLIFGFMSCFYSFFTIYLTNEGLSFSQIGIILAVNSLVGVAFQPIWGYITDKYLNKKQTLIITISISAVTILLFVFVQGWLPILLTVILFTIFLSPINSVADSYCYNLIEKYKTIQYGKVRLMGSMGYAVAALILGIIIKNTTINSVFYSYLILSFLSLLVLTTIDSKVKSSNYKLDFGDLFQIVKDKKFLIFLVSVMIINICLGANGNYIAILIQKTGGDVSNLGFLWFVVAISELPAFFLGNKLLKKFGDINLYIISLVLYSLRYFLDATSPTYSLVILVQIMQGITFPLFLISTMNYVNRIVPSKMRTSGITLYSALGCGLGNLIGNIAGGFILENFNIFLLFKLLSFNCILSILVVIILKKFDANSFATCTFPQ
jgi:oligosaccharide:H+ symporter